MEFKDYYATLGVERAATPEQIKRAYRKLARKFHPDVSKEANAEARFKDVAEAHEALIDPERRAAYDDIAQRHANGQPFEPPPGWSGGYEYSGPGRGGGNSRQPRGAPRASAAEEAIEGEDFSDFFSAMFGHGGGARTSRARSAGAAAGSDHHAQVSVSLQDSYQGATRTVSLRVPQAEGSSGTSWHERQLEVGIPQGVRPGQRLRLAGQGAAGRNGGAAGDLYLEIQFAPHPLFRLDGDDVYFDLPVAPWEAALGATVTAPTPGGSVQLGIPPASTSGRKLRLKGRGLPGRRPSDAPGDLYAVLGIALPPAVADADKAAYGALQQAFATFDPRAAMPV